MKIAWSEPTIGREELKNVIQSFEADWLTQGPKVKQFEAAFSKFLGVKHAIAVNNGTSALDLALKAIGIEAGDEVIVPAMTFVATASAVLYQGAIPIFVDIENKTFNLDQEKIQQALTPKTKAIIFIDYGGNPSYIDEILEVGRKSGIPVIQDAAQSLGGRYKGKPCGSQAPVSTMSFHMAKVMTTVEGGMVFTNNEELSAKIRTMRNHGEDPQRKYHHILLGTNARMMDIQAAIGLEQFKKLPANIKKRQEIAKKYDGYFRDTDIKVMKEHPEDGCQNAYFFYPVLVPERDKIVLQLKENGIDTRCAYPMPVYKQRMFTEANNPCRVSGECPVAVEFTGKVINLPIFPDMNDNEINYVAENLIAFVGSLKGILKN